MEYVCSVCGYVYDEAKGIPEADIPPGTKFADLPADFHCPWCGAGKDAFKAKGEQAVPAKQPTVTPIKVEAVNLESLKLSVIFSELAKACEKEALTAESHDFFTLAQIFEDAAGQAAKSDLNALVTLLENELNTAYPEAKATAERMQDRGALRALVWSEKVARMSQSLLTAYAKEGAAMLANKRIYVCEACGFVYLGTNPPEKCPVCKAPNWRFTEIKGGKA